jgi:hypothetical protein
MDKIGGDKQIPGEAAQTSLIVKCDVCGQQLNRRHLSSHKRLSHGKNNKSPVSIGDEAKAVETILALYLQLSTKSRNNVVKRLASLS